MRTGRPNVGTGPGYPVNIAAFVLFILALVLLAPFGACVEPTVVLLGRSETEFVVRVTTREIRIVLILPARIGSDSQT